jgi:hypothetical protein
MQQPIQSMQLDKYARGTRAWWQAARIRHAAAVELFTCENKTSPIQALEIYNMVLPFQMKHLVTRDNVHLLKLRKSSIPASREHRAVGFTSQQPPMKTHLLAR